MARGDGQKGLLLNHNERRFRRVVGRRFCWHAAADEIAHGFSSADLDAAHGRAAMTTIVGTRRSRDCAAAGSVGIALDSGGLAVGVVVAGLAPGVQATGAIGNAAGFEDDDGDLEPGQPAALAAVNFDSNPLSPVTWPGTVPFQTAAMNVGSWQFNGLTDADTQFVGGAKQDENCPRISRGQVTKVDFMRAYVAHRSAGRREYLELAWVGARQNTSRADADLAFESNQGSTACTNASGLVSHEVGDILSLHDLQSGPTKPQFGRLAAPVCTGNAA